MLSQYRRQAMALRRCFGLAIPRFGFLAGLWYVLTNGHEASWGVGIPVLIAGTCASLLLQSPQAWRWRLAGLGRFLPVFLWLSWRGGFDVALRALHPHCPLTPGLLIYPLKLPIGPARIFFANTVSLLPGTLSANLEEDRLTVHVVDEHLPVLGNLQSMESLVAELFGLQLSPGISPWSDRHE
jgi:multicomponent Na+:H+ antiporter subunit E